MRLKDAHHVAGVLNRIAGLGVFENGRCGNALGFSGLGHDMRLNELVGRGAAGKDEPRCHAALILGDALGDAGELAWGGVAVGIGTCAQHHYGVKACAGGV